MLRNFLMVGLGGAIGAMLRYGATLIASHINIQATVSTMAVNILGSLAMGIILSACEPGKWTLLLTVGLCGGFTTFSTYSAQSVSLLQEGRFMAAAGYILGSVAACILFSYLGYLTGCKLK